jgi:hypothetical protein
MKDIGAAKKIIVMEINKDKKFGMLFLNQHSYIQKILCRFNMHDSNLVSTTIASHFKLSSSQCPRKDKDVVYMSRVPYPSVVGSLIYAMVCSCPDLSYAMGLVSRYMASPGKEYSNVVKWILMYLCGTSDACILEELESELLDMWIQIPLMI